MPHTLAIRCRLQWVSTFPLISGGWTFHTKDACHGVVGDAESISRQIQRERGNSSYRTPIVVGIGEGGSVAGVILAQAPAVTLSGAVAYDPNPSIQTLIPLCSTPAASADSGGGFEYGPWPSLPGFWVAAFPVGSDTPGHRRIAALKAAGTPVEIANGAGGAAETLATLLRPLLALAATAPAPVTGIANLPLIEMPAEHHGPFLAIVLSGDGGWRDVDKGIAEKLRSGGVSVVGWDRLRYFWNKKSPEQTARDLGAVIDPYVSRWGASMVALIGYSFGADVLPFAYNPPPKRKSGSSSCHSWVSPLRPISRSVSPGRSFQQRVAM